MADYSKFCAICDQRHISRQSTDWCSECEQALCAECKEFHGFSKSSRNHTTIPISSYQTLAPYISSVNGFCSDHDEKYQLFCQTHDNLLCSQCIEQHSDCKNVIHVSKIIKNVKTSEAFREAEQSFYDINQNILKLEETIRDKIRIFKDRHAAILSEISEVRQKINQHLDQIEDVIKKDVCCIEDKVCKELETVLTSLKEMKETNVCSRQQLEVMSKHASDLQIFFGLRQISAGVNKTMTFLQSIIDNGNLDEIGIELSVDDNLRNISNIIKTFGGVRVKKSPSDLTLVQHKEKQAQLVGVPLTSVQNIKLKLKQTITPNISYITGCDLLPDGTLVFCNNINKQLVVTDTDGKYLFGCPTESYGVLDVKWVSDKTVAVTTGGTPCGITIIDISSRKLLKFIARDQACFGITSVNGSLVYCVVGKGIEMTDINGENTTTIVSCNLPSYSYIAAYNNKLYYTNHSTNTVTCCDMKGNTIWTFKDDTVLCSICGISVHNDGRVYVVSYGGSFVEVLSADGTQNRRIFSKEADLNNPVALCYDKSRKQLLVANYQNRCFLFELSK